MDSSTDSTKPHREYISKGEIWDVEPGTDNWNLTGLCIIYRDIATGDMHEAFLPGCNLSDESRLDSLLDLGTARDRVIPLSAYAPLFKAGSGITRAPEPYFVKKPDLRLWDVGSSPSWLANNILHEIKVWELLAKHPHPNIPRYFGCEVSTLGGEERITGICLTRLEIELQKEFNPGYLNKKHARDQGYQGTKDLSHVMNGIESAVKHLHSLGWVHRDINPQNIMLGRRPGQEKWEGFLINMNSAAPIGTRLREKGGAFSGTTPEWCNDFEDREEIALHEHDLAQVNEVRVWMSGDKTLPFRFPTFAKD